MLGLIVVNGKFPVGTGVSVAAEKKVDLPTFAFPSNPICIIKQMILSILVLQKLFNVEYNEFIICQL